MLNNMPHANKPITKEIARLNNRPDTIACNFRPQKAPAAIQTSPTGKIISENSNMNDTQLFSDKNVPAGATKETKNNPLGLVSVATNRSGTAIPVVAPGVLSFTENHNFKEI